MASTPETITGRIDRLEEMHRNMHRNMRRAFDTAASEFDTAAFEIEGEILAIRKMTAMPSTPGATTAAAETTSRTSTSVRRGPNKKPVQTTAESPHRASPPARRGHQPATRGKRATPAQSSTPQNETNPLPLELVLLGELITAKGPVPQDNLRQAAITAGRHISGANKAIGLLTHRGFAAQDNHNFTITEAGRRRNQDLQAHRTAKSETAARKHHEAA